MIQLGDRCRFQPLIFRGVAMIFLPPHHFLKKRRRHSLWDTQTTFFGSLLWFREGTEEQRKGMWMKGCKVVKLYRLNHDYIYIEIVHVFLFQYFQKSQNGNYGTIQTDLCFFLLTAQMNTKLPVNFHCSSWLRGLEVPASG